MGELSILCDGLMFVHCFCNWLSDPGGEGLCLMCLFPFILYKVDIE